VSVPSALSRNIEFPAVTLKCALFNVYFASFWKVVGPLVVKLESDNIVTLQSSLNVVLAKPPGATLNKLDVCIEIEAFCWHKA